MGRLEMAPARRNPRRPGGRPPVGGGAPGAAPAAGGRRGEPQLRRIDPKGRFSALGHRLDLAQLWHLVAGAALLVCPDTSVMHIGRLTGAPTIGPFGPAPGARAPRPGWGGRPPPRRRRAPPRQARLGVPRPRPPTPPRAVGRRRGRPEE